MKNVLVRSISGIIYIAAIVGALMAGGNWWYALTAVFTIIGTLEYQRMCAIKCGAPLPLFSSSLDLAATLLLWAIAPVLNYWPAALPAIAVVLGVCLLTRMALALSQQEGDAFSAVATAVFGTLYIGIPMTLLNLAIGFAPQAPAAILCMLILIWLNDTGAFCVGSLLGRHRLCERLSPKKSWEGFWGGMFFCVAAAAIYARICALPVLTCAAFGAVVCIFSTWGDLFESMLKRSVGIKDSGNLIPGHGGILDRIDSLLFVTPAAAIFYLAVCTYTL
ncbi:MAG: phosphatidate cytidylyltransferase [Bacteroidales bacterium]|nr:phosphatidate cytidylyltransferase [Bacteroidales bacterium]